MKETRDPSRSVQLMQEHASRMTRSLPVNVAPGTLIALGVFTVLAALGLSIRVGQIRKTLESDPTQRQQKAEAPPRKETAEQRTDREARTAKMEKEGHEALAKMIEAFGEQVPSLTARLESASLADRTQAALSLREYEPGFPALVRELGSPDLIVRREAANALSLSSDAPKETAGMALLHTAQTDTDALCREYAAVGAGRLAPEGALEGLAEVYQNDASPHVRAAALLGMVWLDDPATLDCFERAVSAPEEADSRYIAGLGIVRLGKRYMHEPPSEEIRDRALPLVRAMLRSANERVRAKGAEAAGYYAERGVTMHLIRALGSLPPAAGEEAGAEAQDTSWEVRARAAEALGRLYELAAVRKTDTVSHIVSALVLAQESDPEAAVRWKAEEGLRRMGYSASRWGKLELTRATPEEVVEGGTAKEYFGSSGEHED